MREMSLLFPGGLPKALTLSYDDGVEQDIRLIEIMNRYGLKGTFNLSGGLFAPEGTKYPEGQIHRRMSKSAAYDLYANCGQEVALHAYTHPDLTLLCPMHPNPAIRRDLESSLGTHERVFLCEPLGLLACHNVMARCHLILTDSGGLQEEGPALGKPVLILRNTTERPEGLFAGCCRLGGTSEDSVYRSADAILSDHALYEAMSRAPSPYGDGRASCRIADVLSRELL